MLATGIPKEPLCFDNEYEVTVVLTKGTKALATQTQLRIKSDFSPFLAEDSLEVYDIMNMPERLTKWELKKKIIIMYFNLKIYLPPFLK